MDNLIKLLLVGFGFVGVLLIAAVLTALPVMWLWNVLMTAKFGLPALSFVDALYMSLLCGLLFKDSSSSSSSDN